jgi:hypothetical protein
LSKSRPEKERQTDRQTDTDQGGHIYGETWDWKGKDRELERQIEKEI